MSRTRVTLPFTAIVGQDALKTALLINAVDPRVGGVLIRGERGTAKSTAVRALAEVLPPIDVVEGCTFGCDPTDLPRACDGCRETYAHARPPRMTRPVRVVDLPVSATEDRVVGTLDFEHALKTGERRFEPGLIADAHRGILYIDEVNLLEDHIVDVLLDVAASGVNVVEREGVRFAHPASFILVGTMNPEEGDLRPQLLDRFGLCVDVGGIKDPALRVEIIRRRRAFEEDPQGFCREWSAEQEACRRRVIDARGHLPDIELDDDLLYLIASVSIAMGVDGHRADLVWARAAAALALLEGEREVRSEHVRAVAPLVLAHRLRRSPFEEERLDEHRLAEVLAQAPSQSDTPSRGEDPGNRTGGDDERAVAAVHTTVEAGSSTTSGDEVADRLAADLDRIRRSTAGRRHETASDDRRGRYVRSEPLRPGQAPDVAFDATLRAAAPLQRSREGDLAVQLTPSDVRNKVRKRRVGASIVFCVDASGSMSASTRMEAAKAAVLDLLVDAYQRRDRVGLVAFRGEGAEVLLAPTASVELAQLKLRDLPTGGATPLAHGLLRSIELLDAETRRNEDVIPWLVLITDGRANVGIGTGLGSEDAKAAAAKVKAKGINSIVIDTTNLPSGGSAAREIARAAGAEYVRLSPSDRGALIRLVKERVGA